jgi:hypothetical protein
VTRGSESAVITVGAIAFARSGDKSNTANIGVAARDPRWYAILCREVTAARVKAWFADVCLGPVERYELPNLHSLNFVLRDVLDGGASRSLRIDNQGKTLCDGLMFLEIEVSQDELAAVGGAR